MEAARMVKRTILDLVDSGIKINNKSEMMEIVSDLWDKVNIKIADDLSTEVNEEKITRRQDDAVRTIMYDGKMAIPNGVEITRDLVQERISEYIKRRQSPLETRRVIFTTFRNSCSWSL